MNKKKNSRKDTAPEAHPILEQVYGRLREVILLALVAFSIFLLLTLMTYHRSDPGWSHIVNTNIINNAGGVVGAWLSDFLLYIFGYFAYLFPLMLIWGVWIRYQNRGEKRSFTHLFILWTIIKMVGFLLILFAGTGLASLLSHFPVTTLPYSAGGILGFEINKPLLLVFNIIGTTFVLITFLFIGLTLFAGVAWTKILESIGHHTFSVSRLIIHVTKHFDLTKIKSFIYKQTNRWGTQLRALISQRLRKASKGVSTTEMSEIDSTTELIEPLTAASTQASLGQTQADEVPTMLRAPRYKKSKVIPKISLLDSPKNNKNALSDQDRILRSSELEQKFADFGVTVKVVAVRPGPVVTRYELDLAAGTKVSKVTGLVKDLARSLSVISVRIVEVIPGKSVIGIELPNDQRLSVSLQEVLSSKQYQNATSALTLALGKDIAGHAVVVDLAKMPHLLVAGTTGSGKSVSLNAMLLSLLYKSTPEQLRLILIDPKMLELAVYDNIPHLLTPVVTDMKDAASALRWCVAEMERRYRLMAALGVRNIKGYNQKVCEALKRGAPLLDPLCKDDPTIELQKLPQIVILADEFADMMVVVGKKVETLIARLAQKARAAGVHLIFATQRPSVDVITGLIKANIPTRIAFQVSSKIDSRTILDQQGAEQLLGNGDMLYLAPGSGVPVRVHGAFVSDDEVHRVVAYLKSQAQPDYLDILSDQNNIDPSGYTEVAMGETADGERDDLYDEAVQFIVQARRVSTSSVQRRFKIGYNRAARIVDAMEAAGVISSMQGHGVREVLVPKRSDDK